MSAISLLGCGTSVALATGPTNEEEEEKNIAVSDVTPVYSSDLLHYTVYGTSGNDDWKKSVGLIVYLLNSRPTSLI